MPERSVAPVPQSGRWINWFTLSGVEGLKSLPAGRTHRWPFEHICTRSCELVKHSPDDIGYQFSHWSTELLTIKINERRTRSSVVIYQPVYSHVERLWQARHITITRNHQCRSMWQRLKKIRHLMETVSPYPGGQHDTEKSVAVFGAVICCTKFYSSDKI